MKGKYFQGIKLIQNQEQEKKVDNVVQVYKVMELLHEHFIAEIWCKYCGQNEYITEPAKILMEGKINIATNS